MKQTSVQEFALALMRAKSIKSSSTNDFIKARADALQMEKEQIIEFGKIVADKWGMVPVPLENIEDTYNETFKSE